MQETRNLFKFSIEEITEILNRAKPTDKYVWVYGSAEYKKTEASGGN